MLRHEGTRAALLIVGAGLLLGNPEPAFAKAALSPIQSLDASRSANLDQLAPHLKELVSRIQSHISTLHHLRVPLRFDERSPSGALSVIATRLREEVAAPRGIQLHPLKANVPPEFSKYIQLTLADGFDPLYFFPRALRIHLLVSPDLLPPNPNEEFRITRFMLAVEHEPDHSLGGWNIILLDLLSHNPVIKHERSVGSDRLASPHFWKSFADLPREASPSAAAEYRGFTDANPFLEPDWAVASGYTPKPQAESVNTFLEQSGARLQLSFFPYGVEIPTTAGEVVGNRDYFTLHLRSVGRTGVLVRGAVRGLQIDFPFKLNGDNPELEDELNTHLPSGRRTARVHLHPDSHRNQRIVGYTRFSDKMGGKSFSIAPTTGGLRPEPDAGRIVPLDIDPLGTRCLWIPDLYCTGRECGVPWNDP